MKFEKITDDYYSVYFAGMSRGFLRKGIDVWFYGTDSVTLRGYQLRQIADKLDELNELNNES